MERVESVDLSTIFNIGAENKLHDIPVKLLNDQNGLVFPVKYFARPLYVFIWNWLCTYWQSGNFHLVIKGSPGIGKSFFCYLFALWVGICGDRPVVYARILAGNGSTLIYIINKTGCFRIINTDIRIVSTNLCKSHFIFLDGITLATVRSSLLVWNVLCTSGQARQKDDSLKVPYITFSAWSLEEIVLAMKLICNISPDKSSEMYNLRGGNIRRMFETDLVVRTNLNMAVDAVESREHVTFLLSKAGSVGNNSIDSLRSIFCDYFIDSVSGSLVCDNIQCIPVSEYVREKLVSVVSKLTGLDMYDELLKILSINGGPLYGMLFEENIHRKIEKNKRLKLCLKNYRLSHDHVLEFLYDVACIKSCDLQLNFLDSVSDAKKNEFGVENFVKLYSMLQETGTLLNFSDIQYGVKTRSSRLVKIGIDFSQINTMDVEIDEKTIIYEFKFDKVERGPNTWEGFRQKCVNINNKEYYFPGVKFAFN